MILKCLTILIQDFAMRKKEPVSEMKKTRSWGGGRGGG